MSTINPTRKQLTKFQTDELEIVLKNGMRVSAPAYRILGALLFTLTEDQRMKLFQILVQSEDKPFMFGASLTVPATLPKGYTDGIRTY